MKKTIVLLLTFVLISFIGFSQNKKDSTNTEVKKIEKRIIIMTDDDGEETMEIETNGAMYDKEMFHSKCGGNCKKEKKIKKGKNKDIAATRLYKMSFSRKLFALMPVFLFLFLFIVFIFWLRRENYKLSDALSSKNPQVLKTTNTIADPSDPSKTITETKEEIYYPRSASKLIAFFTAIAGIVIVICGLSYHAYTMLSGIGMSGGRHHGGGIIVIAIILLVGMLPYIFRTMFKK